MDENIDSFKTATEIRNLEIKLFWQRSNYFLVLNTAVATAALLKINDPEFAFLLSIFGFLVSLMWISINLGGKYWQNRWERKIAKIESSKNPALGLFAVTRQAIDLEVKESMDYENVKWYRLWTRFVNYIVMWKPSVSRTMILLSFVFMFFWIVIGLHSFGIQLKPEMIRQYFATEPTIIGDDTLNTQQTIYPHSQFTDGMFSWDVFWNFVSVLLGILISFWIERKIVASRDRSVQKTLISLVADEVEMNIERMNQIVIQAQQTIVPYYQLVTENKHACWPSLVEYPISNRDLVGNIAKSYNEYQLINRTLDMIFFNQGANSPIFGQSTIPLCKAEIPRSQLLLSTLRQWVET
jgi:hypothetical protein